MVDLSEEGGIESRIKKDIWKYLVPVRLIRCTKIKAISCSTTRTQNASLPSAAVRYPIHHRGPYKHWDNVG